MLSFYFFIALFVFVMFDLQCKHLTIFQLKLSQYRHWQTIFVRKVFLCIYIYTYWCLLVSKVMVGNDLLRFVRFFGKKMQDIMIWCFSYIYIYLKPSLLFVSKSYIYIHIYTIYIYIYTCMWIYIYLYIYIWILFVTFLSSFY